MSTDRIAELEARVAELERDRAALLEGMRRAWEAAGMGAKFTEGYQEAGRPALRRVK